MIDELPTLEEAIRMEKSDVGEVISRDSIRQNPKTSVPLAMCFRKTTNDKVLFIGEYMEVYISKEDFKRSGVNGDPLAHLSGQTVKTFGIFEMHIWTRPFEGIPPETPDHITRYMYPSKISMKPSGIANKTVTLMSGETLPCVVLQFQKNSIFIDGVKIAKSSQSTTDFIGKCIFEAFLPSIVRYDEIVDLMLKSAEINGANLNVTPASIEIMVAAQCRYSNDLNIPYRIYLNKFAEVSGGKGVKPSASTPMKLVKLKDLPHYTSTWASFSFENIDYAITSSAVRHLEGRKEEMNDVEKAIKY